MVIYFCLLFDGETQRQLLQQEERRKRALKEHARQEQALAAKEHVANLEVIVSIVYIVWALESSYSV